MNIVFFGSTEDSVVVARALHKKFPITAVVTQPAKPVGRDKVMSRTPVDSWATEEHISVLTFETFPEKSWLFANEDEVTNSIETCKPDLLVSASFGERIPKELIEKTTHGGINVHPSLLPRWRGTDPTPWTILAGDAETGVTIVTVTEKFDDGRILAQKKIPITQKDMPDELRKNLFTMGAELLVATIPDYVSGKNSGVEQKKENVTIAKRITRDDGFIDWNELIDLMEKDPEKIDRKFRALYGWPGLWTKIGVHGIDKRVKILDISLRGSKLELHTVQLEGKNPVDWNTFKKAYLV